ncbi:MAG: hypothetical protein KBT27_02190 [Prevotellaceae bacterium]|nr:hypothetical protein [Candidatus Faecinaster equi]
MITVSTAFNNGVAAPVRTINAKVEVYQGSTLVSTYTKNNSLIKFDIQRTAEGKFFGMGISQRLNVHLLDIDREISISTANNIIVYIGIGNEFIHTPRFYVSEVHRDENTNQLSITAYDLLNTISKYTVADLDLITPYTIQDFIETVAEFFNTDVVKLNIGATETCFDTEYSDGANLDGTEDLREVLRQVGEVTQTTVYIDSDNNIVFKRLPSTSSLSITKDNYFTLKSSGNNRLQTIMSVTELGDNVEAHTSLAGSTQYCRDNPFWDIREDVGDLVQTAINTVGNMTIGAFDCMWRGHPALEIGDKITFTAKDGSTFSSYVLDDTITYDGTLNQKTKYDFLVEEETASNPATIGDKLKQTYARVDKVNKQIELVVSEESRLEQEVAALQINTQSISASVSQLQSDVNEGIADLNNDITELSNTVSAKMTAEDVRLEITEALSQGVEKVSTTTGFTFDENGISIDKTGSEMATNINENGMRVSRDNTEVLTADNQGVNAINLTARQYLIVGTLSRLEDFNGRTACFWLGGNS